MVARMLGISGHQDLLNLFESSTFIASYEQQGGGGGSGTYSIPIFHGSIESELRYDALLVLR